MVVGASLPAAALIASRSVQSPAEQLPSSWSLAVLTVKAPAVCVSLKQPENSEVPAAGRIGVAVAVTYCAVEASDAGIVNGTFAVDSTLTVIVVEPANAWPSPFPDGSQTGLPKTSTRYAVPGVPGNVPETVPFAATSVIVGKLWTPAVPFRVMPSPSTSIPSAPLLRMPFWLICVCVDAAAETPLPPLFAIVLPTIIVL